MSDGRFDLGGRWTQCALGKGGVIPAADKREGDGCSPLGVWPIRRLLYRPDKLEAPKTLLPVEALSPDDGWCDAPMDRAYNRPVKLPYPASAEAMWREDGVYDLVLVLAHNDDPPIPLMGSAIFLHVARSHFEPTEGCVALQAWDLLELIAKAEPASAIAIVEVNPKPLMEGIEAILGHSEATPAGIVALPPRPEKS
jgi:L,D-peptidoglycan transpeptidase YkuD (ErfK/YbiS/YcfS/YnhG family)